MKVFNASVVSPYSLKKVASIYKSHSRPDRDKTTHERVMEAKALLDHASYYSSIGEEDMKQLTLPFDEMIEEDFVFEVYQYRNVTGTDRAYSNHITFVRAPSMTEAEDRVTELYPEFWKNSIAVRKADLVAVYTKMDELERQLEACIQILG